uniref:Aminotransferase-like plant mobile domain-containing protein n=1 Tax=Quercus lobata TaxID=97700 RepID=A0A7N2MVQ0_QUELO
MELSLRERVQAFSFKDSNIGDKPALFIYSEKDNKEVKPLTLITRPPIIGEFSPKWDWDICPPNLPQWSQAAPQNVDASATLLLASHHTNIASMKPYLSLGREIVAGRTNWEYSFNMNGGISYIPLYWEWLEDILSRCKETLKAANLYEAVFASLFTYDFNEHLVKSFCECWSPTTNTLHTLVVSISTWDLHKLGGLPIRGLFYDEVVPTAKELEGVDDQGKNYLPQSCHYLFIVYHHLQHQMKKQSKVNVNNWIAFWFKGDERYPTPKKQAKKGLHPKRSQNPSGLILDRGPWKDKEHAALFDLQDLGSIRASTFKIASLMASGEIFGLAVPILASIYRGLNTIFNNPVPSKSSNGFAVHYVYAWMSHFFKSHRVVNDELEKPMMTRYSGVSYEVPFEEVSARDRIRSGKDFFWHGTSFRSDLDLTFEDNGGLSVLRLGYFMSLCFGYLSLRCEDHCVVESYSPHRFSRRFGFYQNIPSDLKKRIQTAKIALFLAKPPASKSRKGKKEQATMSPSHQLQFIENPSSTTIAVQKRGTKHSSDMQYEDTLVVSDDDASKDSDANWNHIRKSSKGISTMTLADHVPTSTHNKPSIVNLETKKHKVNNAMASPKPVNDTNKVSSQQEQGMSMSKQGALMLGDLLLSQLSDFTLNKIFPKDESVLVNPGPPLVGQAGAYFLGLSGDSLYQDVDRPIEVLERRGQGSFSAVPLDSPAIDNSSSARYLLGTGPGPR